MAGFQMFVTGLDGKTCCLQIPSSTILGSVLHQRIANLSRIPSHLLFIVSGCRVVTPQTSLCADGRGFFATCNVLLRLRGGKGGFGSLLRGAATKAGHKKTSNFDACRDMSGRRLRHVNAEKKLKEWRMQVKERELEKAATSFIKRQLTEKQIEADYSEDLSKFSEAVMRAREEVVSAVALGLVESKAMGKRTVVEEIPSSSKRPCLWQVDEGIDVSDDEDDVDAGQANESYLEDGKIDEGTLLGGDIDVGKMHNSSMIDTGDAEIDQAMLENVQSEENVHFQEQKGGTSGVQCELPATMEGSGMPYFDIESSGVNHCEDENCRGSLKVEPETILCMVSDERATLKTSSTPCQEHVDAMVEVPARNELQKGAPLNFDNYHSVVELEVLGLERLKQELQDRGLKCGGNLTERAARLFLLKTCTIEKLDKKHFAKTSNKSGPRL